MRPSAQVEKLKKEVGLNNAAFWQRAYFAEWIAAGFTFEEMIEHYRLFPSVPTPRLETLKLWGKQWEKEEFHLKDGRSFSTRPRRAVRSAVVKAFKAAPRKSAGLVAKATGYTKKTVCKHLKQCGMIYGQFTKVPHKLTATMRKNRVRAAKEMLAVLKEAEKEKFMSIVTMDETPILLENESCKGWYFAGKPKPCFEAKTLQKKKFTLTIAWGAQGILCVDGCTGENRINSKYFCSKILKRCKEWCDNRRKGRGVNSYIFHMDNAPCHKSRMTLDYMAENNIARMVHPAYSPDLSPCDFYLFGFLKYRFADTKFKDMDDALEQITYWVKSISKEDRIAVMREWMRRLQRCIDLKGEYVFIPNNGGADAI